MTEPYVELDPESAEPLQGIAVIGMSGRFPGARTLEDFWRNLEGGVESITFFTDEELAEAGVDPRLLGDSRYVKAKAQIDDAELFDAAFFGFTPREAEWMDPQHRIFLECAWAALEDAGYDPERFRGRVGVYAGSGASSYLVHNLLPNEDQLARLGGLQVFLLNDRDFLATRVSYKLNLRGPSMVVQTACSTSLVAIHTACQSLFSGECDMAMAGGVSISVPLRSGYFYQEGGVSSPDGHCRAFDAAAGGSVEGNGAGVVVLKRLAEALADGDHVYAVIRGSAVNNDGSSKVGFTAPSVEGQAEVISESLMMAGVEADTIGYVEAHGSGTALGDPIEAAALVQAFRATTDRVGFCGLGSVKTNVGHCNTAAGVAGFSKAVLALVNRKLPPSLHFETPNPQIELEGSPFYVCASGCDWQAGGAPRRAGVSSFGLGGTNAHIVLEEAPEIEPGDAPARPRQLLVLSARTPAALDAAAERLAGYLEAHPDVELADVAWTLQAGRKGFDHRRIAVASDVADAVAALRDPRRALSGLRDGAGSRPVVFLFPGLGDQYVDMARELYDAEPVFREQLDLCADGLGRWLGTDLREVIFAGGERPKTGDLRGQGPDLRALLRRDNKTEDAAASRLGETAFAQPAFFAVEYALAKLLMSWGIEPEAMIGYSIGEYVAACLAGVLSLDDALSLVARRAKLIQDLPAGGMLAVPLPESEVKPMLDDRLSVSATNGPHFCVIGGPAEALDLLERRLSTERGAACIRLQTTHAFHSSMMEPAVAAFTGMARPVRMNPPSIPYLSNVTGTWITEDDLADPGYWARHMRGTVRFAEGLGELLQEPSRVYLEVGPGGTLGTLVKQHPDAPASTVTALALRRGSEGRSDVEHLLEAVGRLWLAGVEIDWERLREGERRLRLSLPSYPFERQRYWVDPPKGGKKELPPADIGADHREDLASWFWMPVWKQAPRVRTATGNSHEASWLVFLDHAGRAGLGERVAARLRRDGYTVATVAAGAGFEAGENGAFTIDPARRQDYDSLVQSLGNPLPSRILHFWGVTEEEPSYEEAQKAGLFSLVLLEQAVTGLGGGASPIRIAMVANGLHEVADGDPVYPAKATVLGAVKVVHQESARLTCNSLDIALPSGEERLERLAGQLLDELAGEPDEAVEAAVAFRGRQRWVRDFEPVRLEEGEGTRLAQGGVYLITDGVHGPGMAIAEHLVRSLDARVALIVPPQFPERGQWATWKGLPDTPPGQDAIGAAIQRLTALEGEAGLDSVLLVRAQPGEEAGIRQALAETRARFGAIRGVFHTTGAFTGGLIQLKTPEALHAALDPAALGAQALLRVVSEDKPEFVLLCSSTLAVTGGLGQIDSAAAGSFLDALAVRAAEEGGPFTLTAHWDPYQWDGWLAGAAMAGLPPEEMKKNLELYAIPLQRSGEALRRLLAAPLPRMVVSARDLRMLIRETDAVTADTLLAQMAPAHQGEKAQRPAGLSTEYAAPRNDLEEQLAALWQELFGIEPIGVEDSFLELGGHSLLAIQTITQIRNHIGVELPVTALFETPTIAGLAKSIRQARGEESEEDLEALLALVEGLSPDEAAERLSEMGLG